MTNIVDKPWGREIYITPNNTPYAAKIINMKTGFRTSLQYHDKKTETFILYQGKATILWGPDKDHLQTEEMTLNKPYHMVPFFIHRVSALTDCIFFEVSTPETGTTFRVEDDYNRPDETEEIRNLPNRGWIEIK